MSHLAKFVSIVRRLKGTSAARTEKSVTFVIIYYSLYWILQDVYGVEHEREAGCKLTVSKDPLLLRRLTRLCGVSLWTIQKFSRHFNFLILPLLWTTFAEKVLNISLILYILKKWNLDTFFCLFTTCFFLREVDMNPCPRLTCLMWTDKRLDGGKVKSRS